MQPKQSVLCLPSLHRFSLFTGSSLLRSSLKWEWHKERRMRREEELEGGGFQSWHWLKDHKQMAVDNTNKNTHTEQSWSHSSRTNRSTRSTEKHSQTRAKTPVDAFPTLSLIRSHQTKLNICIQIYSTLSLPGSTHKCTYTHLKTCRFTLSRQISTHMPTSCHWRREWERGWAPGSGEKHWLP